MAKLKRSPSGYIATRERLWQSYCVGLSIWEGWDLEEQVRFTRDSVNTRTEPAPAARRKAALIALGLSKIDSGDGPQSTSTNC